MRSKKPKKELEQAVRMVFLNRTCYNGMYRVNSKGEFNVPFGDMGNPKLYENKDWINSLSNDFKIITMKSNIGPKLPKHMWEHKPTMFIVFAHYKNLLGQVVYKFLGEFHLSLEESDTSQAIFIRKKTKIYFDNL